jgi:hypothetical protein
MDLAIVFVTLISIDTVIATQIPPVTMNKIARKTMIATTLSADSSGDAGDYLSSTTRSVYNNTKQCFHCNINIVYI